jgi:ATP-dependent Clp protease protease subunit
MKNLLKVDPLVRMDPSKFMDAPVIIRVSNFDEEAAEDFAEDMSHAHNTGQPVIPVVIDSPGGMVYSLLSMISQIQNSRLPVATIGVGHAMSCAAVLLSCGTDGYRFIDPNATVMIHDISMPHMSGKTEEIKAESEQTDRLQKQVFRLMAKNCGHRDQDYFLKILHDKGHAEWYLTAKEAQKHGLVNHLRIPQFTTEIKVDIKFE